MAESIDTLCIHCGAELLEDEEDNNQLLFVRESGLNHSHLERAKAVLSSTGCHCHPQHRICLLTSRHRLGEGC